MMPPQRRFSAAPNLTCPHRNKSSSHSSSSLYQTYSIDSSESMITVIPSNRGQEFKRTSRGSLSCNSSGGCGMDSSGSFYALPRSPLSPRSPSRCSPGLLTPNTSEPPTILEPQFSPTTTTCSSIAGGHTTVIEKPQLSSTNYMLPTTNNSSDNDNQAAKQENCSNQFEQNSQISYPNIPNFSLTPSCLSDKTYQQSSKLSNCNEADVYHNDEKKTNWHDHHQPDTLVIKERINDLCARHSKEELEFLIGQIRSLKIIDCYFSERSSTLCMVIEVLEI